MRFSAAFVTGRSDVFPIILRNLQLHNDVVNPLATSGVACDVRERSTNARHMCGGKECRCRFCSPLQAVHDDSKPRKAKRFGPKSHSQRGTSHRSACPWSALPRQNRCRHLEGKGQMTHLASLPEAGPGDKSSRHRASPCNDDRAAFAGLVATTPEAIGKQPSNHCCQVTSEMRNDPPSTYRNPRNHFSHCVRQGQTFPQSTMEAKNTLSNLAMLRNGGYNNDDSGRTTDIHFLRERKDKTINT